MTSIPMISMGLVHAARPNILTKHLMTHPPHFSPLMDGTPRPLMQLAIDEDCRGAEAE